MNAKTGEPPQAICWQYGMVGVSCNLKLIDSIYLLEGYIIHELAIQPEAIAR